MMNPDEMVGMWITGVSHQMRRQMDSGNYDHKIPAAQGRVLHYILVKSQEGDVYQRDIERAFRLRGSSATGLLQMMERGGLITRQMHENDKRLKRIVVTDKAIHIENAIREDIDNMERRLISAISEEERKMFLEIIKKISASLDAPYEKLPE